MTHYYFPIYHTSFKYPFESKKWNALINMISVDLKYEVEKYVRWEDQHNTLLGKLLVYLAYNIIEGKKLKFENYKRDKNNKPFLQDSIFNFNISHSDKTVVCVISQHNIQLGIDIEKIKKIDVNGFANIFHQNEFNRIIQTDGVDEFYKYWTRKEAFTKTIGSGITLPLDKIDTTKNMISRDENDYYLESHRVNKYYYSLAYNRKGSRINWVEIKF